MWIESMDIVGGWDEYSWPMQRYESSEEPYGREVVFLNENGWDSEREHAAKLFTRGQVLTVKEIWVGRSSSKVEFVELPGKMFNTVMFADKAVYDEAVK